MRIIAGEARGRIIEAPAGLHTRPTLDQVREALFNILDNAVKYTPPCGHVTVSVNAFEMFACISVADSVLSKS